MRIEIEREEDGRWLAEVPELPGVMVYAAGREEVIQKVKTLALRVLAERLDHGEEVSLQELEQRNIFHNGGEQ